MCHVYIDFYSSYKQYVTIYLGVKAQNIEISNIRNDSITIYEMRIKKISLVTGCDKRPNKSVNKRKEYLCNTVKSE